MNSDINLAALAAADPVLLALTEAGAEMVGAQCGWMVSEQGDGMRVVAAVGNPGREFLGDVLPTGEGTLGYVLATGQPLALSGIGDDSRLVYLGKMLGRTPSAVLCVPCTSDDAVLGALEFVDKRGGGSFTYDDVEIATALAGVAGVALAAGAGVGVMTVPSPADLSGDLGRLSRSDPTRYALVARAVRTLLVDG